MALSRRRFIKAGSLIALTAGIPLKAVAFSTTQQKGSNAGVQPPTQTESTAIFSYTKATFTPQLNTTFQIKSARTKQTLVKLTSIVDVGPVPDGNTSGECFALVFTSPSKLLQDTYEVEHAALGKFLLFIVPVGKPAREREYEAIINRLN